MYRSIGFAIRAALLAGALLAPALAAAGENAAAPTSATQVNPVSPEAQAVLDRMTSYLRGLQEFSVESRSSRDEVVEFGYKLQHNERVNLVVARPNQLRADVSGDVSNRSYVFDGAALMIYSADDQAYIRTKVPVSLPQLLENMLAAGIEMPLIDVLYQSMTGTLTDAVRGGVLVGDSTIDGVACDQLAFRQADIDWQLWVEKGERPLPRKILITTRHEVGEPQFQAVLTWNTKPAIGPQTFAFAPPKEAVEIPFRASVALDAPANGEAK